MMPNFDVIGMRRSDGAAETDEQSWAILTALAVFLATSFVTTKTRWRPSERTSVANGVRAKRRSLAAPLQSWPPSDYATWTVRLLSADALI